MRAVSLTAFSLVPDDDAPSWVTDGTVCLVEGGWEPGERLDRWRTPWTRQQRRIYHRCSTVLHYWEHNGYQGLWVMLSSAPGCDPELLASHHARLVERVERERNYPGIEYFVVKTAEGENLEPSARGVLHVLWFWRPPVGSPHRYFQVPWSWLTAAWQEIHGAKVVTVSRYRPGAQSKRKLSRYLVSQYCAGQNALVRYFWSWRRTFGVPIVALWLSFRRAHGGATRAIVDAWQSLLEHGTAEVAGQPFTLARAT